MVIGLDLAFQGDLGASVGAPSPERAFSWDDVQIQDH